MLNAPPPSFPGRRPQLAGAGGDITSPGRPRDPGLASPAPSRRRGLGAQCPAAATTRSSRGSAEPRAGRAGRPGELAGRASGAVKERDQNSPDRASGAGTEGFGRRLLQTWARAGAMKMVAPWTRFYSHSCCLCCHVRTGTILLGVWYLIINSVVLLVLLSALADPDQYHFSSSELGGEFEFMDDANMCIAIAISLLMILICAMATYGAYKQHAAWIIPFFCYQIFDFALNTLVAITVLVYPNSIQEYIRQLPPSFPYRDDIMSVNPTCLVLIILLFIGIVLAFKGYLISCVWSCYRYINGRNSSDVLVYVTSNDTTVLLPPYNDATAVTGTAKEPPPPYVSA